MSRDAGNSRGTFLWVGIGGLYLVSLLLWSATKARITLSSVSQPQAPFMGALYEVWLGFLLSFLLVGAFSHLQIHRWGYWVTLAVSILILATTLIPVVTRAASPLAGYWLRHGPNSALGWGAVILALLSINGLHSKGSGS